MISAVLEQVLVLVELRMDLRLELLKWYWQRTCSNSTTGTVHVVLVVRNLTVLVSCVRIDLLD